MGLKQEILNEINGELGVKFNNVKEKVNEQARLMRERRRMGVQQNRFRVKLIKDGDIEFGVDSEGSIGGRLLE